MNSACRVVLADDMIDFRLLLKHQLRQDERFVVVGEAADGAEAVRIIESERPDVVLLDLAMPVMDGLEAIPEIRRASPETKIVILSGFDETQVKDQVRTLADAYVRKAGSFEVLIATLQDLCGVPV